MDYSTVDTISVMTKSERERKKNVSNRTIECEKVPSWTYCKHIRPCMYSLHTCVVGYPGTESHASPDHPQIFTTNVITPFKCYNFSPIKAKMSINSRDSKFVNCYFANSKQSRILCWAKSGLCYKSSQMHLFAMFPIFS